MDDRKAKGTILIDFVKMIKTNKNLDWSQYLIQEDWEVINSLVLPSKWYPLGVFYRCSMAVFHLIAKDNLEVARANGQMMGKRMFETTYKSVAQCKDPMQGMTQFVFTYSSLFNFSMLKVEKRGPKHATVGHFYDAKDKGNIPFCSQMQGILETLVQMTGGKNHKVVIGEKQWEGAPATIFSVTWE